MPAHSTRNPPLSARELSQREAAADVGLEIVDRPESWGLPMVEGHQVTLGEWRAFEAFTQTRELSESSRVKLAARVAGVKVSTIYEWRKRPWWTALFETHVELRQQEYHADLMTLYPEAARGLQRVLQADPSLPPGAGTAMVRGAELLTRLGKKPLQDSRNVTTINNQSIDNRGGLIVSDKTLEQIDDQERMLKVIHGEIALPED